MTCCSAMLRVLENIPIIGHLIAACYACAGSKEKAERAAIKSTVGIILAPVNIPAEAIDEASQHRTERLKSGPLLLRRDWMKKHKRKVLRSLCLPGSHSSGMYKVTKKFSRLPLVDGWARCQQEDIYLQLMGGIRFLDVRIVNCDGDVYVVDDACYARGVTLKDLLSSVKRFVSENPSEIICIHLQEGFAINTSNGDKESSKGQRNASNVGSITDVDWNKVKLLFHELLKGKLIPEIMRDLVIGDIIDQGRNVFVCGLPLDINIGWHNPPITHIRPHDPSPAKLLSHLQLTLDEPPNVPSAITWYHAESPSSSSKVAHSMGGVAGLLAKRHSSEKYDFLEDLAAAVNWSVLEAMRDINRIPLNTLTMDYVQNDIIERIIQLNDAAEVGKYSPFPTRLDESMASARYSSMVRLDESMMKRSPSRIDSRMDESILGVEGMRVSGVKLDESIMSPSRPSVVRMDESTIGADYADYTHNNSMMTSQKLMNLSVMTASNMNTSFDFRPIAARPIQVRDTTV